MRYKVVRASRVHELQTVPTTDEPAAEGLGLQSAITLVVLEGDPPFHLLEWLPLYFCARWVSA
jgi:hypothetical protein